jgi:hypothetical protein
LAKKLTSAEYEKNVLEFYKLYKISNNTPLQIETKGLFKKMLETDYCYVLDAETEIYAYGSL